MKYEVRVPVVVIEAENEQEARDDLVQAIIEDRSLVEVQFVGGKAERV